MCSESVCRPLRCPAGRKGKDLETKHRNMAAVEGAGVIFLESGDGFRMWGNFPFADTQYILGFPLVL